MSKYIYACTRLFIHSSCTCLLVQTFIHESFQLPIQISSALPSTNTPVHLSVYQCKRPSINPCFHSGMTSPGREPRRLTILRASTVSYSGSFTLYPFTNGQPMYAHIYPSIQRPSTHFTNANVHPFVYSAANINIHPFSGQVRSRKPRLTAVGIRCADHVTPSTRKSRHYFADSGGRSVVIVRLRTKATEYSIVLVDRIPRVIRI
jgi:hypothetical protein